MSIVLKLLKFLGFLEVFERLGDFFGFSRNLQTTGNYLLVTPC